MTCLHIDFETRSVIDLKKQGVYVYAEHPLTDVACAAYCFDEGPVHLWKRGEPCPAEIKDHILRKGEVAAWNASFERILWWGVLSHRHGWPRPSISQFRCVMVQAMAMSLPASLEMGAAALGISEAKDMAGSRLAIQMSKPRKWNTDGTVIWWDDDERLQKLYAYCKQDVIVEREADKRLVPLRPSEQKLWELDQKINDRGVKIDIALCRQAAKVVEQATDKLDKEMSFVTQGDVTGVSQVQVLSQWLRAKGVDCTSVAKDALTDLLALDTLPPECRRALEIRKEGAKASVAKIKAMINCVNKDGRARGLLQFHGAGTGRWAGRRLQPHNMTRPSAEFEDPAVIDLAVQAIMTGDAAYVEMMFGSPLSVVSDCLRSMLCAGV